MSTQRYTANSCCSYRRWNLTDFAKQQKGLLGPFILPAGLAVVADGEFVAFAVIVTAWRADFKTQRRIRFSQTVRFLDIIALDIKVNISVCHFVSFAVLINQLYIGCLEMHRFILHLQKFSTLFLVIV